jgi:formate/nitrite transporter FocA (FNT family)
MFSVPLYFQVTQRTSNTVSGAHLVPAVVGNALGGLISGLLIKRCVWLSAILAGEKQQQHPKKRKKKKIRG